MKRATILSLCLLLSGTALATTGGASAQSNDAVKSFWQKFKTAVIGGDKETVATLSRFPIRMSYGVASVKNSAQFMRRWREVFNVQSNAAQCFAKKGPEMDESNPKRFSVACPNEAGDDVVVYEFARTPTGWKFIALDNINE
ncbi:MAG: hypothetical protein WCF57_03450 [Pyrinomonadaceae bacterium]